MEERSEETAAFSELLQKLHTVCQELRAEAGGLVLFGLFERSDASGRLDLVVAADWVDPTLPDATAYIAGKLQERLTADELVSVGGVITLPSTHPFIRQLLTGTIRFVGGLGRIRNSVFNDIPIAHAWIFTADIQSSSRFQPPPYVVQQISAKAKIVQPQKSGGGAKAGQRRR